MDKVYIVMPAYNEEENIETVAREWHEVVVSIGKDSRLAIIDDGSKDNTYQILCELCNELPQLEGITKRNSGHGATLLYAYEYALKQGVDFIFQTDSDGQTIASEFWPFWEERHQYEVQIGHRSNREDGLSRIFVTKVLKVVVFIAFRLWIVDVNSPFRLMKRETLQRYLPIVPAEYNLSNALLTILFEKNQVKLRYLPVSFRPRQGGINSINMRRIVGIGKKAIQDFRELRKIV